MSGCQCQCCQSWSWSCEMAKSHHVWRAAHKCCIHHIGYILSLLDNVCHWSRFLRDTQSALIGAQALCLDPCQGTKFYPMLVKHFPPWWDIFQLGNSKYWMHWFSNMLKWENQDWAGQEGWVQDHNWCPNIGDREATITNERPLYPTQISTTAVDTLYRGNTASLVLRYHGCTEPT